MNPPASPLFDALAVLVAQLTALRQAYHQSHVFAQRGQAFPADHQLLQRLYTEGASTEQIDQVLERLSGLFEAAALDPSRTLKLAADIVAAAKLQLDNPWTALAKMEQELLKVIGRALDWLGGPGKKVLVAGNRAGVENLLQGLADTHQTNLYLLTRRTPARKVESRTPKKNRARPR